ncbi:DNA-binding protein Alba [Candidatus Bathyarchaeota archaeon]|nr:DNA-binding protein Alba [Candidatus Bathyarchaeota archaeon]
MAEKSGIVFIGSKPPMDYVLAVMTRLSAGNAKEVILKARGQAITTAVDVAEITRNRFLKDLKVSKVAIGTEEMPPREGENRARMVSTIEITLTQE